MLMQRQVNILCHRCQCELGDEQIQALRGITGLKTEQIAQYKLRLYCERCERFRKQRSGRTGYFILLVLLVILVAMIVL